MAGQEGLPCTSERGFHLKKQTTSHSKESCIIWWFNLSPERNREEFFSTKKTSYFFLPSVYTGICQVLIFTSGFVTVTAAVPVFSRLANVNKANFFSLPKAILCEGCIYNLRCIKLL